MSAKSLVDAAPRRKRPKMLPMYHGSRPRIVFTVDQPATLSRTPRGMAMVMFARSPRRLVQQRRRRIDPAQDRRHHDDPEALATALGAREPGEHPRDHEGGDREPPGFAQGQPSAGERPLGLVDPIDVEVVDLVDGVVGGVEDRGHQRAEDNRDDQIPRDRRLRVAGAPCRDGAARDTQGGRQQRERSRELGRRSWGWPCGGTSNHGEAEHRDGEERAQGGVERVQKVVVEPALSLGHRADDALGEAAQQAGGRDDDGVARDP